MRLFVSFFSIMATFSAVSTYNMAGAVEDEIAPKWSKDGHYIYFYSYRDPDPKLVHELPSVTMRMKSDGTEKAVLSDRSSRNWWLVPDVCEALACENAKLFVVSERDAKEAFGGSNLYYFDPVQGIYEPKTEAKPEEGEWILMPSLSLDGRYLSYIWQPKFRDSKNAKLFVLDRESDKVTPIILPYDELHEAVLKPDGLGIIFSPNNFEIYDYDFHSKKSERLYQFPASEGQFLDGLQVSPDGKSILFSYGPSKLISSEIYTLTIESKKLTRHTNNAVADFRPSWHPSGEKIAFNRMSNPERDWNDIMVLDLTDGSELNFTNNQ